MVDTVRSKSDLLTQLFQDGQTAGISAQDLRDLIVSFAQPYGGLYFSSAAESTIAVAGTFVKAAGTTTTTNLHLVDDASSTSNRLRYTGTIPMHFQIWASVSLSLASGTNQTAAIQLYKYDESGSAGALIAGSDVRSDVAATDELNLTCIADVSLDTNDYIELHVANISGTVNLTVDRGYIAMTGTLV